MVGAFFMCDSQKERDDGTKKFIEKYRKDGIIWYFDNFSLSA